MGGGRGHLVFANGVLRGRALSGGIGRSAFRDGALALQLVPTVGLRDLGATIDADLAEALAMARAALDRAGAAALADLESLHGRAAGSFAFERRGPQPSYRVELTSIGATGRYRGVPFPLAVSAGEVRLTQDALHVRGLSGTVGRSRVTGASGRRRASMRTAQCAPLAATPCSTSPSSTRGSRRSIARGPP